MLHIGTFNRTGRKIFKDETGVNFTDYINNAKMEKARFLLKDNIYPVADIARRLGYGSSAYFIKKFKSKYGMTPGEFGGRNKSNDKKS